MNEKELTTLEKLPMYLVAWSLPLAFAIMAAIALGFYPYGDVCVRVLKAKFMVVAVVAGTVFSLVTLAIRNFSKKEKANLIGLAEMALFPLAYFTFYFAVNKFLVAAICLVGIVVAVYSAQGRMKNRTTA